MFALDEDLIVRARASLPSPVDVCARRDGGAWVLCALEPRADAERALARVRADGALACLRRGLAPGARLSKLDGRSALLVQPGGDEGAGSLERLAEDGATSPVWRAVGLRQVAVRTGSSNATERSLALALAVSGEAELTALSIPSTGEARVLARGRLDAPVVEVAAAGGDGDGEGWWALEADVPPRLVRLDAGLRVCSRVELELDGGGEAPGLVVADSGAPWLFSRTRARIERRDSESGARRRGRAEGLPHGAATAGTAWRGGALFATGGALLHLDDRLRIAPGQGGFRGVVSLSVVPP